MKRRPQPIVYLFRIELCLCMHARLKSTFHNFPLPPHSVSVHDNHQPMYAVRRHSNRPGKIRLCTRDAYTFWKDSAVGSLLSCMHVLRTYCCGLHGTMYEPILKRGHSNALKASHNMFIRFRSKDVSLERLHYQLSTNLGLLQANLTYMHSKFWYGLSLDSRIIPTLEAASV